MDPNQALASLLCGHMVLDHAEALESWLKGQGFEPVILRPADVHPFFAAMPEGDVGADAQGVFSAVDSADGQPCQWSWPEIYAAIRSGALSDSE